MSPVGPAGAVPDEGGTTFRAWAPRAERVEVRLFDGAMRSQATQPLRAIDDGWHEARLTGVGPGALYKFVLDGRELPDPYARFLPFGVDGPAQVVGRRRARPFQHVPSLAQYVVYELHVGTFTPEGTYAAARHRLEHLVELGVTAIELMPLSSFPGQRGWGYDGVAHFAPFAPYGPPDELQAFVDQAHALGLAVLLDVVYNHFGPRGNYLGEYAREYFGGDRANAWGSAPDFRVPAMRQYVLDNARMWFDEYGFDGLRLDATHTLHDPSPNHILRELAELAASYAPPKRLIAEDDRNDPSVVAELGMDAVWADDFHHGVRVLLTGERDGYYGAYAPTVEDLARTIERGWLYEGQRYDPWDRPRGRPAEGLRAEQLVYCVENHDQVGNRAFGTRLDRDAGTEALLAATAVLLFLPATPLLFMGQEWASSSPFLFFTDHDAEYGPLVSRGRREEFGKFRAFADPAVRERIPDPQAAQTFEQSKLRWEELQRDPHRRVFEAVRAMLHLRRTDPVLRAPSERGSLRACAREGVLVVDRTGQEGRRTLLANLSPRPLPRPPADRAPLLSVGPIAERMLGPFSVGVWAA